LGASLGCSFVGMQSREILRILGISVGSAIILISVTVCFGVTLSYFLDLPVLNLLLAFSPGGLTETSLIALSLNVEVAFVALHHILRVTIITMSAALVFRGYDFLKKARGSPDLPSS